MGRRAVRREESAARLRALTRRAYTASAGHLNLDDDAGREFDRIVRGGPGEERGAQPPARRWAVSVRAAVVVLAVITVLTGLVVLRSLASASAPVPLPELTETADAEGSEATATAPDAGGDAGAPQAGSVPPAAGPTAPGRSADGGEGVTSETTAAIVVVHVAGEVTSPGVVELPVGARVADAIDATGGPTGEAELAAVNLARQVQDGEQVYVPAAGEVPPGAAAGPGAASGGSGMPGGADAGTAGGATVDLNTADAAALDTLPGVGPAIAQRILEWREANGPFHSVDELLEVSGIGPATLERLRDRVRV